MDQIEQLNTILNTPEQRIRFRAFLLESMRYENIFFLEVVNAFNHQMRSVNAKGIALGRFIQQQFIAAGAPLELNLNVQKRQNMLAIGTQPENDWRAGAFADAVEVVKSELLLEPSKDYLKSEYPNFTKKQLTSRLTQLRKTIKDKYVKHKWNSKLPSYTEVLKYNNATGYREQV